MIPTEDEMEVLVKMRKYGPYATFHIEKKPQKGRPDGMLIRIVCEESQLLSAVETSKNS